MYGQRELSVRWRAACKAAGVPYVPIRDATRKSTLKEMRRRLGASYEQLREIARHSSQGTTEIYVETGDAPTAEIIEGRFVRRLSIPPEGDS